jgi:hypothetical protein
MKPTLLLCHPDAVPLREPLEELVATVADRSGEVAAIPGLEIQDR